jgi:N-acetylglutamate synthase-like GNAT family acetyltransferase
LNAGSISIREATEADRPALHSFLSERHSAVVARLGRLENALEHPALIAEDQAGAVAGVLTYIVTGDECEILTLHTATQWTGAGTALIEAVEPKARRLLRVLTTNDNVDALRFYQRRGFHLRELHPGAVNESRRRLKPEIPVIGEYGIPLRDEIVLEKEVTEWKR